MSRLAEIRSISSLEAATDADLITAIAADEASKNDERKKEEQQRVEKEAGGDKKEITTDISATKQTTTIATTTTIASTTTTTTTNVIKTQKSHSLQKVAGAAPNDAENAENAENAQEEEEEERDAVFHGDNREGKDAGFDSPARYFANATYPATNSPTLGWVISIKHVPFVP